VGIAFNAQCDKLFADLQKGTLNDQNPADSMVCIKKGFTLLYVRHPGGQRIYSHLTDSDVSFAVPFAINTGPIGKQVGKGIGHFFGAMDIESFRDTTEFKKDIDAWINTLRSTRPLPGEEAVLIPGDPEREAYGVRLREGIPLNQEVVAALISIEKQTGIPLG